MSSAANAAPPSSSRTCGRRTYGWGHLQAESFKDEAHLDAIVKEAQEMVNTALGLLRLSPRARLNDMNDHSQRVNPPPFPAEYRSSGVLLHVASLPSPYGIGDVGPAALAWIDRLHEAGQSWCRRCRWVQRGTATPLINPCRPSPGTSC